METKANIEPHIAIQMNFLKYKVKQKKPDTKKYI